MKWLYRLERKYGRFGIQNLMAYVVVTMAAVFLLQMILGMNISGWIILSRYHLLQGQIWRLITFIFMPPSSTNIFYLIIGLYFYYFIGRALEQAWSPFLFTMYYLFGIIGAIIAALISGSSDNTWLNLSLLLAYAQLFPESQFRLFFIIPFKVKYLQWIYWGMVVINLIIGTWQTRAAILMSLVNFFIFFGGDIYRTLNNKWKYRKQRKAFRQNSQGGNNPWR